MKDFAGTLPATLHFPGEIETLTRLTVQMQMLDAALWQTLEMQFLLRPDGSDLRWRGEFWGKLLRGGSLLCACTKNAALYDTLEASVRRMLSHRDGRGVLSTYTPDTELTGWDVWCRKYVMLGMEYFLDVCRDDALRREIVAALEGQTDALMEKLGTGKTDITRTSHRWLGVNSCSVLEAVVRLYRLTKKPAYLDFAAYIVSTGGICEGGDLIELALQGVAPADFPEQKAYETMSFFEGVLEYGRETGDERCLRAAEAFARKVLETDVTVIGTCGCTSEKFDHSILRQSDPANLAIMQETCVTVTWMRLCLRLLLHTGDRVFADALERSFFNAMAGTVNTENRPENDGLTFDSYSPLTLSRRGRKTGGRLVCAGSERVFGCCAANGGFGIAVGTLSAALAMEDGICLCFYRTGTIQTVTPAGKPLTIDLTVDDSDQAVQTVTITLHCEAERFRLRLRVPDWTGKDEPWQEETRLWQEGDTVHLELPTPLLIQRQNGMICFRHGSDMLARDARTGEDLNVPIRPALPLRFRPGTVPFPTKKCFRLPTADGEITLCDYASCGKTWNDDSQTAVWLPEA